MTDESTQEIGTFERQPKHQRRPVGLPNQPHGSKRQVLDQRYQICNILLWVMKLTAQLLRLPDDLTRT